MVRIISFLLGIISLLYFGIYAALAGLTNKFTYFWLLFGILCILLGGFYAPIQKWLRGLPLQLKIVGGGALGICILALIVAEVLIINYGASEPQPDADYVIVLGTQVRGRSPSYNLARRLDAAYDYLMENPKARVILSGGQGQGEEISEAQAMAEYLQTKGVPKERMILEDRSRNTYENLKYSQEEISKEENSKQDVKIVLVTNNFHVFRSIRIAQKQGIENVEGLGASVMWYTVPNLYLREAFAVVKYALCGQI